MSSSLIVEVCKVDNITDHPNADTLALSQIKGWQTVVKKNIFSPGDLVTYIPIDAVVPQEHSDRWGITQYLSKGRVRCARLRGEPSFGVLIALENPNWEEGQDVAEYYGITKFEPPIRPTAGATEREHPLFQHYTSIENMRNFPAIFKEGEEVVVSEKIHGTSCRVAIIEGEWMAGSHHLQRLRPETDQAMASHTYWHPFTIAGVRDMLEGMARLCQQVILYGEIFGPGIQNLHYGMKNEFGFRAFDILIDGTYLNDTAFQFLAGCYDIPVVPELYRGPFNLTEIKKLSEGNSELDDTHIREGVVVKPLIERNDPKIGRVILKYLGDSYLLAKGITDATDV